MHETVALVLSSGLTLFLVKQGVLSYKEWRNERKRKFDTVLPKVSEIYEEMNHLRHTTKAGRVIILKAHNGGGRPKVGTQLFSSAIYEVWGDLSSVKDHWQNQELDEEYTRMLVELDRDGKVETDTAEMKDGVLKRLYFSSHILHTVTVKISQDEKSLYYLSINFHEPTDILEPSIQEAIRGSVNRLKQLWG